MSRRPPALLALMFLVALSSAACSLPAAGTFTTPTVTPSPTPTVTPTPTPTPTPVPETRLDQAEWALFIGDWDRAQEAFRRAAEQAADPQIRGAAQLGIGTVHLRAGRFGQAETELTAFLETFPDHPDSWRGHFLRGVARQEAGDGEAAIADFDRYLALRPGRIDGYVHENLGDLLRGTGRPVEAVDHYRAALEADRLDNGVVLQVKVGMSYYEAERYEDALAVFNSLYETAPSNADKATANLLAGRTLEELGRTQEAHERYLDSVDRFPQAHDTYIGLIS
ncbi:MAG: tetratricopeptide repeat protein, partial [Anaerolineales bacterium]|nr:tetratricopeptide repeat protein [Anaerolineales bacterium]